MNAHHKPVHELRIGSIKAALWQNDLPTGPRFTATFCRLYRDQGQWRRTESFGRDDLLVLSKLADLAHSWICERAHETDGTATPPTTPKR